VPLINLQMNEMVLFTGPVSPLWEQTETLVLGLKLSENFGLGLDALCGDEARARRVERTLQAVITLGENMAEKWFPALRLEVLSATANNPDQKEKQLETASQLLSLFDFGEQMFSAAKVTRDGTTVRMTLSTKTDLAASLRLRLQAKRGR
jgi:hypothetical protein